MSKVLVAYATMAGSTAEVAQTIGEEIAKGGASVDVLRVDEARHPEQYDAVVLGGPMIVGWHRSCVGFLKKHRTVLKNKPLAIFLMAMSLTKTTEMSVGGLLVTIDENLPKPPIQPGKLSFREGYARLSRYLQPAIKAGHPAIPRSIGVFGGRLEYGRLKWWAVLFVMFIIQAPAGDRRNWPAIRAWAASLVPSLGIAQQS